jgi:hypothetical protein
MFGGVNAKEIMSNDLYILRLGKNPLVWLKPKTLGQKPVARI